MHFGEYELSPSLIGLSLLHTTHPGTFQTLSYLVLPIDILDAKRLPIIGWFDEIASLSVTYQKVCKNITPEIEAKVDAILDRWFPDYAEYIELPA